MFPFCMSFLTVLIIICFLPPIQKLLSAIKPVDIHVSVAKFDIDYGVGLSVP